MTNAGSLGPTFLLEFASIGKYLINRYILEILNVPLEVRING